MIVGPVHPRLAQPPLGGGLHQVERLRPQPHHQHLAFRIAEAHVVLDQPRRAVRDHQPGIEHPLVGHAAPRHLCHRRAHDLGHRRARRWPRSAPGPGNRRPCRRYWGRYRLRPRACDPARCRWAAPSRRRKARRSEASSPVMNSSITTSAPAPPKAPPNISSMAASASASSIATITPLPAASPSALTTIGAPCARTWARAASASVKCA